MAPSSSPLSVLNAGLRRLDMFNKTAEDYRVRTLSGGVTTIVCIIILVTLLLSELSHFASKKVHDELFVDVSREKRIDIDMSILFRRIPCVLLNLEISDPSGKHQHGVEKSLHREDVDVDGNTMTVSNNAVQHVNAGNACGSCYGAETATRKCCTSCSDIIEAYLEKGWAVEQMSRFDQCKRDREEQQNSHKLLGKQGCRLRGRFNVNRVSGGLHISPGRTLQVDKIHIHDLGSLMPSAYNTSHVIETLSFGPHFPDKTYPLNQHEDPDDAGASLVSYYLKIVPTIYAASSTRRQHQQQETKQQPAADVFTAGERNEIVSYQFSISKHSRSVASPSGGGGLGEQLLGGGGSSGFPGVIVSYEMSPLLIKYSENRRSFMHFLTNCCAIFGGVFALAVCIDLLTHQVIGTMKRRLGKFT